MRLVSLQEFKESRNSAKVPGRVTIVNTRVELATNTALAIDTSLTPAQVCPVRKLQCTMCQIDLNVTL